MIRFMEHKFALQLKKNGTDFVFKRAEVNKFHEPTGEYVDIPIIGILHSTNSYINKTVSEAAQIKSKKIPMILTDVENIKLLKENDRIELNNAVYEINDINDVNDMHIMFDISLGEVA